MRYGLLADVHGNYRALRGALTRLREQHIERLIFLGDLVGYGAEPAACVDVLRRLNGICTISGNHDRQLVGDKDPNMRRTAVRALEWTRSVLNEEQIKFLQELPQGQTVDDIFIMVHGSLASRDAYILTMKEVVENRRLMLEEFKGMRVCFFAHTHIPMLVGTDTVVRDLKETKAFQLDRDRIYLINPGSVGQPRDKCPLSSFGVFDTSDWTMTFFRESYDIDGAKAAIVAAGLPEKFARRLEIGV